MKLFAIGDQPSWDALTAPEQAAFDAHYLTWGLGHAAIPLTKLEDYKLLGISDTLDNTAVEIDFNAISSIYSVIYDGGGYTWQSGTIFNMFKIDTTSTQNITIENFCLIYTRNTGICMRFKGQNSTIVVRYNFLTTGSSVTGLVYERGGSCHVYANVYKLGSGASTGLKGDTDIYPLLFENNTMDVNGTNFVDVNQVGYTLTNNYADFSSAGTYTDGGGNVDKATTPLIDAFEDTDEYIPKTIMSSTAVASSFDPFKNNVSTVANPWTGANGIAQPPTAPTLLTPLNDSTDVSTTVQLTWNETVDKTSYNVQVSKVVDFTTTVIDDNTSNEFYNTSSLDEDQKYYWRVNVTVDGLTSDWSSVFNFTTISSGPAPEPSLKIDIYDHKIPRDLEGLGDVTIGTSQIEIPFNGVPKIIRIQSDRTNTGVIFIGNDGILNNGSNSLIKLLHGDEVSFEYNDIKNKIFAISDVANQKINVGALIDV